LAVQTADCVPLALWSGDGAIAVVHVGWRGFEAGIIASAVAVLRRHSTAPLHAVIGPSIGPECYEFGATDLDRLCATFGESIRSRTTDGRPALDVRAGVRHELEVLGVGIDLDDDVCTACDDRLFSHRARSESGRQSTVIWLEGS
jgi:copper oxidase (laccase) domain-containing protein